jgi:hypothetical protein
MRQWRWWSARVSAERHAKLSLDAVAVPAPGHILGARFASAQRFTTIAVRIKDYPGAERR